MPEVHRITAPRFCQLGRAVDAHPRTVSVGDHPGRDVQTEFGDRAEVADAIMSLRLCWRNQQRAAHPQMRPGRQQPRDQERPKGMAPREWPQGNGPRECCRDAARSLRRVLSPRPRETGARVPKGRPSSPSDPWPPTSAASAARVNHQGSGRSVSWSSLSSTDCDPVYPINLATLS